jgi:phosphate:Na+ symporter
MLFPRHQRAYLLGAILIAAPLVGLAADVKLAPTSAEIDWFTLAMGLFGGLALFLAGLDMLSEGLKKAAGKTLKILLGKMTDNRLAGAFTGAFVTAVLNSSSVTTVLVVGFITAGIMTLPQSVGVIMGANIGSTMTAQLLAFNVSSYALLAVAAGFFMTLGKGREKLKYAGMMTMGLGLVFFGMGIMSESMSPLRSYEPFMTFLKNMERPFLGILAGALFTGLVQSSAATVGIAIAMAGEGLLTLPAGIALALGANIGTCVTALLASIGKPAEAVRAAVVHILFNIVGVLIWLPFIDRLADLAVVTSAFGAVGTIPRQIANANTLFNGINMLLFIGFSRQFAGIAEKLVPERQGDVCMIVEPRFLDESTLAMPSVALDLVRREFGRMGRIAATMLSELPHAVQEKDMDHVDTIVMLDDKVDILEKAIFRFLSKIRQRSLTREESKAHQDLMTATVNLESLADIIEKDLSRVARKYIVEDREQSHTTRRVLARLYREIHHSVELAVKSMAENDRQAAKRVIRNKGLITELTEELLARKSERLGRDQTEKLELARLEMSLVDKMHRTYNLARRIAKIVAPEAGLNETIASQ